MIEWVKEKLIKIMTQNIHQSYFALMLFAGIIIGTIVALVFRFNYFGSWWWVVFVIGLLTIAYIKPRFLFVVVVLIGGMILAFMRCTAELRGENYIKHFVGQTVVIRGVVDGDPETDENTTKLKLTKLQFGNDEKYETAGNLYISLNRNEKILRGDSIELEGIMLNGFGTYAGYLYRPLVRRWERAEPRDLILVVRDWFAERIRKIIPAEQASLGLSYLLGMKTELSGELDENLRTVGLVHIVVASGTHLSILVEVAKKLFGRISRFAGLVFSIMFVMLFMLLVGFTPSILRAGLMTILTLVTWYFGRKISPWRLILMVMAVTLVINPMFIINMGWLLSFASYGGIMLLSPWMMKFFYGIKRPSFVGSIIITTISATVMTLPIVLYYYGTFSLISVLANLLILPTLPYAMGLVFATGVVSGIPGIETAVAWCTTKLLDFHVAVIDFFGTMKQFIVEIPMYQKWVFLLYGGIVIVAMILFICRKKLIKY